MIVCQLNHIVDGELMGTENTGNDSILSNLPGHARLLPVVVTDGDSTAHQRCRVVLDRNGLGRNHLMTVVVLLSRCVKRFCVRLQSLRQSVAT